jgi:hypothetical protein
VRYMILAAVLTYVVGYLLFWDGYAEHMRLNPYKGGPDDPTRTYPELKK